MRKNYLKTLTTVSVYSSHSLSSDIIETIAPEKYLLYNREKLREGVSWMEINLDNTRKGYLKKNKNDFFICKHVKLIDDLVIGFDYNYIVIWDKKMSFVEIFEQATDEVFDERFNYFEAKKGRIEIKRIPDIEKGKVELITLKYNKNFVSIKEFQINKKERFYITYENSSQINNFIEIENFLGKKGIILSSSLYATPIEEIINRICQIIGILSVLVLVLASMVTGWIIYSGLYLIPALFVAGIFYIILKILAKLIMTIFHQIRIRV